MRYVLIVILGVGILVAENISYRSDPEWRVPAEAAAKRNPLADRPAAAGGGRKLFMRNCAECHGNDGRGLQEKHSANLQLAIVQSQSDGALFWKITNGNVARGMPPWSRLPEAQRWQLVLYIRSLERPSSP